MEKPTLISYELVKRSATITIHKSQHRPCRYVLKTYGKRPFNQVSSIRVLTPKINIRYISTTVGILTSQRRRLSPLFKFDDETGSTMIGSLSETNLVMGNHQINVIKRFDPDISNKSFNFSRCDYAELECVSPQPLPDEISVEYEYYNIDLKLSNGKTIPRFIETEEEATEATRLNEEKWIKEFGGEDKLKEIEEEGSRKFIERFEDNMINILEPRCSKRRRIDSD
ncbi:MAG: hypothetical protein WCT13_06340 [Patescibacteria group bacterium]